jgi:hypothetical protein
MEKWRHAFPIREDFVPTYTQQAGLTTGLVLWAPMLCGLNLLRADHAKRLVQLTRHSKLLEENIARYIQFRNHIAANALTQQEAIDHMRSQA